jgi:hypothetical protein
VVPDTSSTSTNTNTSKQTEMNYQLVATNASSNVRAKATAGNLVWTSGYANPTQIKFQAMMENTKIEYKSNSYTRIDLFSPSTNFGSLMLPGGMYKKIELKIKLESTPTVPALELRGTYTDNGIALPVVLLIEDDVEFKVKLKDVYIDETNLFTAVTAMDLSGYTNDFTMAMLQNVQLTNGTLIISKNSNRNLYNIIMQNLSTKEHEGDCKKKKK